MVLPAMSVPTVSTRTPMAYANLSALPATPTIKLLELAPVAMKVSCWSKWSALRTPNQEIPTAPKQQMECAKNVQKGSISSTQHASWSIPSAETSTWPSSSAQNATQGIGYKPIKHASWSPQLQLWLDAHKSRITLV